ncbi:hypothetical protein ScPMuIL_002033 [Solemya velum]
MDFYSPFYFDSYVVWTVSAIGCFVCTSINGDNNDCEDRFNNTDKYYEHDCWASRKGRIGKFPGTECIKMTASDAETGFRLVVRDCVVDDGGTNSETEIGRQSHCGWLKVVRYDGKRMRGCILSCDTDACNTGEKNCVFQSFYWTLAFVVVFIIQHKEQWFV